MIGVIITCKSHSIYSMKRISGSSITTHTEQQLQSYLQQNGYRRIHKDKTRPWDRYVGLWIVDDTGSDGDDAQAIAEFMHTTEYSV